MTMYIYRAAEILPWSLRAMYKFFILFSYWEVPFFAFQINTAFPKSFCKMLCISEISALYCFPLSNVLKANWFS